MFFSHHRLLNMIREKIVSPIMSNTKHKTTLGRSYEDAIDCINSLQTNRGYIKNATSKGVLPHSAVFSTTLAETEKYLLRTGITLEQLDKLSIIHVAGTKGKGSTCAFCENILRQYGYRTGFYSSPHLVAVRERIRINGKPLSQELFAENVFRIYNELNTTKEHAYDMPAYFRFLTVLAFNVFLAEKVDVVILEVGIGGEYDCTNIVRNTPIVGITSLGIDHTHLLGSTIEEIAWQKAGIMKPNSKVYTVRQPEPAMNILMKRSEEKLCTLETVPQFDEYLFENGEPILGINAEIQKVNASLAIQLSHNWLKSCGLNINNNGLIALDNKLLIPQKTKIGLETVRWPGRYQILKINSFTFYLDGAHTTDSLKICANWFLQTTSPNTHKALIFNATGERKSEDLLFQLTDINFNSVMFVPNSASSVKSFPDQLNVLHNNEEQIKRCESHKNTWINLEGTKNMNQSVSVLSSVAEAINHLPHNQETEILITGSLHLVGAALNILDPNLQTF